MTAGLSNQDAFALVVAVHRLVRSLRRAAPVADLGPSQLIVMSTLFEHGPMRIGELAVHIHSSQPNTTATVRNLESAGLVSREADPADRRAIRVTITPTGHERILTLAHGEADLLHARASTLPEADQLLLRAITPVLRELADPSPALRES